MLYRCLLAVGADVFIKDNEGASALDMCAEYREDWLLPAFEVYGAENKLINRYLKELKDGGEDIPGETYAADCLYEYVCALIMSGYATKAASFINKNYAAIKPEKATAILKKIAGEFDSMVEPLETFELLHRHGARVDDL